MNCKSASYLKWVYSWIKVIIYVTNHKTSIIDMTVIWIDNLELTAHCRILWCKPQ